MLQVPNYSDKITLIDNCHCGNFISYFHFSKQLRNQYRNFFYLYLMINQIFRFFWGCVFSCILPD